MKFADLVSLFDSHSSPPFDDVVCFAKHLDIEDVCRSVGERFLVRFDGPRVLVGFAYGNAWRNLQIDRHHGLLVFSTPPYDRAGHKFAALPGVQTGSIGIADLLLSARSARRKYGFEDVFTSVHPALLRRYRPDTSRLEVLFEQFPDELWRAAGSPTAPWSRSELDLTPRLLSVSRESAPAVPINRDLTDSLPECKCATCTGSLRADGETGSCEHNQNAWKNVDEPPWSDCCFYRSRATATPKPEISGVSATNEWLTQAVQAVCALETVFGRYRSICHKQKDKNGFRPLVVEWGLPWLELLVSMDDADGSLTKALDEALMKHGAEKPR